MSNQNIINTYATKGSVITVSENTDKKKETIAVDKELYIQLLNSGNDKTSKADELGLWKVWAYHCVRCNHVWFPRYAKWQHVAKEEIIFNLEPPKSCARCKSKYWNTLPQREIKKT